MIKNCVYLTSCVCRYTGGSVKRVICKEEQNRVRQQRGKRRRRVFKNKHHHICMHACKDTRCKELANKCNIHVTKPQGRQATVSHSLSLPRYKRYKHHLYPD